MRRWEHILRRLTRKRQVLDRFQDGSRTVEIVDEYYLFGLFPARRIMDGGTGYYSAIFLNPRSFRQPVYTEVQDRVETWAKSHDARRFLVLGCAGCSIPRYFILRYPDGKVTGVENSQKMLDAANRYFLFDLDRDRLTIVQADAFEYVRHTSETFDVCFVDLFDFDQIVPGVYDEKFLASLAGIMSEDSMVLVNFYGQNMQQGTEFCRRASHFFNHIDLATAGSWPFPILMKDSQKDPEIHPQGEPRCSGTELIDRKRESLPHYLQQRCD